MDRAPASEAGCRRFESCQTHIFAKFAKCETKAIQYQWMSDIFDALIFKNENTADFDKKISEYSELILDIFLHSS